MFTTSRILTPIASLVYYNGYVVKFSNVKVVCSNNNNHLINKSVCKLENESQYYLHQKGKKISVCKLTGGSKAGRDENRSQGSSRL